MSCFKGTLPPTNMAPVGGYLKDQLPLGGAAMLVGKRVPRLLDGFQGVPNLETTPFGKGQDFEGQKTGAKRVQVEQKRGVSSSLEVLGFVGCTNRRGDSC